jgi:hypothetical protein
MRLRCTKKNHEFFKDYGGRGITVCKRWCGPTGFVNFLSDVGEAPSPHTRFTLGSLPAVVREAMREGVLVVFRNV